MGWPPCQNATSPPSKRVKPWRATSTSFLGTGPVGLATVELLAARGHRVRAVNRSGRAAAGRKGKTRAEMAQDLLEAHRAGRVRVAIGRASDYFGPHGRLSAMGERVFYPALTGKRRR